jgi:hypothetical protein
VEGAEGFFGPDVEASFFGEAGGELVDDEGAGDEEEDGGDDPEADGGGAVVSGGGDPAGADTVAILKRRTSQKPMVLRSWDLVSGIMGRVQGAGYRVQGAASSR